MAFLRLAVRGDDEQAVGRAFSGAVVETSLASYPGTFFTSAPRCPGGGPLLADDGPRRSRDAAHRVRRRPVAGHAARGVRQRRRAGQRPPPTPRRRRPARPARGETSWSRYGCSSARARATRVGTPTSGVWADAEAVAAWLRQPSPWHCSKSCSPRSALRGQPAPAAEPARGQLRRARHPRLGRGLQPPPGHPGQGPRGAPALASGGGAGRAGGGRAGRGEARRILTAARADRRPGIGQDGARGVGRPHGRARRGHRSRLITAWSVFTALVVPRVTSSRRCACWPGPSVDRPAASRRSSQLRDARSCPVVRRPGGHGASSSSIWLCLIVLGVALIEWYAAGVDFATALGISGSSVFTLGIVSSGHAGRGWSRSLPPASACSSLRSRSPTCRRSTPSSPPVRPR